VVEVEQFVEVPGGTLYVKRWEPAQLSTATPIVLIHDSLGCVGAWRDFPFQLAQRTHRVVIAYDRLGFGRSSARQELPSARFIEEEAEIYLPAILSALKLSSIAIFGYSVGGEMALVMATEWPSMVDRVIVMSAQLGVEEHTVNGIRTAQKHFEDPAQVARLERWHGPKAEWALRAWWDVWLSEAFSTWRLEPYLPRVKCPVLAIHGDRDEYGSLAVPQLIARLCGGSCEVHILEGCGHTPLRDRTEAVLALSEGFLGIRA